MTKAQGITGAMTVEFEGKERTFPEMKAFLESNDRDEREKAWKSMVNRWMDDSEELSEIYDELIKSEEYLSIEDFENLEEPHLIALMYPVKEDLMSKINNIVSNTNSFLYTPWQL